MFHILLFQTMAPERSSVGVISSSNLQVKKESKTPSKSSFLEEFLEINIKEGLEGRGSRLQARGEGEFLGNIVYPAKKKGRPKREEDQDLTPLSWLQSNNLLKSKRKYSSRLLLYVVSLYYSYGMCCSLPPARCSRSYLQGYDNPYFN